MKHYRRQLWHCFLNQLMVCECYKIVTQIYFLNVMLYKMIMWCVQTMVKSASGSNCVKSLIHNINFFKIHSLLRLYLELSVQLTEENCLIKKSHMAIISLFCGLYKIRKRLYFYYYLNKWLDLVCAVSKSSRALFYAAGFCCASFKTFCFFLFVYTVCS